MCSYALKHLTRSLSRSHTFSTSIIAPLTRPPTTYAINYSQPHSYSTASHHQTQSLSSINPRQNDHPPAQPPDLPPQTHQGDAPPVVATHLPRLDGRARQRALRNNIFNPMDELEVAGIGTVEIPVVRSLDNPFDTHTIVLENVLHIPEAVCNGFNPLLFGSSMSCTETAWMGADREAASPANNLPSNHSSSTQGETYPGFSIPVWIRGYTLAASADPITSPRPYYRCIRYILPGLTGGLD
ncbi:hypothetical protein CBS147346_6098 [Aspergillus niger]|nr:hypothetical protein CBS147346_6098 [Aspergillus niger]